MINLLIQLLVGGISVIITSYLLPGVKVDSFVTAMIVAVVLTIANMTIKPIMTLLTLPLTIITLGLFTFVINALMVLLVAALVPGFAVSGFISALLFSIVLSVVQSILHVLTK